MPCYSLWSVHQLGKKNKIQRSEGVKKGMWRENCVHMLSAQVLAPLRKH